MNDGISESTQDIVKEEKKTNRCKKYKFTYRDDFVLIDYNIHPFIVCSSISVRGSVKNSVQRFNIPHKNKW